MLHMELEFGIIIIGIKIYSKQSKFGHWMIEIGSSRSKAKDKFIMTTTSLTQGKKIV